MSPHLARAAFLTGFLLSACDDPADSLEGRPGASSGDPAPPGGQDAEAPALKCAADIGKSYVGFGKSNLVASRVNELASVDRGRQKPFGALAGEFARVLGNTPASLAQAGTTLDDAPDRWYVEPKASAVSLYTAYSIAFEGCLTYTASDAKYAAAPTAATAAAECGAMTRKFWSRVATPDELAACAQAASVGAASEPDARRKWAYTCAAVLTSAGFLTY